MKRQFLPWHSYPATAAWGVIVWLLLLVLQPPPDLCSDEWARRLLLLAALCWVPLGLGLLPQRTPLFQVLILPAAIGLSVSMQFSAGWSVFWALPWLGVTAVIFIRGAEAFFQYRREAGRRAVAAGQVFLLVGGLAAVADRLGLRPFGFDAAIILLTAVHFHYAGFIFPLLVGRAAQRWPSAFFRWAATLVVVSVPATAVGITVAQLTRQFFIEALAGTLVAQAGWLAAMGYLRIVWRENIPLMSRIGWGIMAVGLLFSLSLATAYALRAYWPLEALQIPAMRALHGTVNALGVAGGGLLGWNFFQRVSPETNQ